RDSSYPARVSRDDCKENAAQGESAPNQEQQVEEDERDRGNGRMCLQLQRDDIEAALSQKDADDNVALQLQLQELNLVETAHNDHTIAQSVSRAVFNDREILAGEIFAKQQATRDRELAQGLPSSGDIHAGEQPGPGSDDEQEHDHYGLSITCVACTDQLPWFDILEASCGHRYCVECLTVLFRDSMVDETMYPPRCCRQAIPLDDAKLVLHPKLVRDFEKKSIELDTQDRTYCFDPRCSAFIPTQRIADDVAGCLDCGKGTCATCKAAAHRGDCPRDENLQQLLQAAAVAHAVPISAMSAELPGSHDRVTALNGTRIAFKKEPNKSSPATLAIDSTDPHLVL
ncbi:unnamed protein product, partial [Aureobasidium vineae]